MTLKLVRVPLPWSIFSWFKTGDVVYYDSEGWWYKVDRIKDMIKVNCYQGAPTELGDVIRKMVGRVLDVAIIILICSLCLMWLNLLFCVVCNVSLLSGLPT